MATYFLDTSALVKLYVAESGSQWVREIADSAANHDLVIAAITGVETVAAITRRLRAISITQADAETALADFKLDFSARSYTFNCRIRF